MKITIVLLGLIGFAMNSILAQDAATILMTGLDNNKVLTYKAFTWKDSTHKDATVFYNCANPDGTFWCRLGDLNDTSSFYIDKGNGVFQILGKTAIKAPFVTLHNYRLSAIGEQADYSLKSSFFHNRSCYVVTKRIVPDDGRFSLFMQFRATDSIAKESLAKQRAMFEHLFPTVEIYYIGKSDNFIYAHAYYNVHGEKIDEHHWDVVEFNPVLTEDFFTIPSHATVYNPKGIDEFVKVHIKTLDKEFPGHRTVAEKPGLSRNLINVIDDNFESVTSILSRILFWASIGCVVVAIGLKLRKHYSPPV